MSTISAESLVTRLTKSKAGSSLLLLGKDAYLRDVFRERVIETSTDPAARGWAVSRFSADEGEMGKALAFTVLILEAGELDQRTKFAKLLLEKVLVVAAELPEDPHERARTAAMLASQMARERNSVIEEAAAEELADLCNCDLGAMRSEIEKLATYAGEGQPIRREDVEALVVSEKKYSVWELAEVLASRQRARAFHFLANVLEQGEAAPALIGAMAWMYRKLIEAQQLSPHTSSYQAAGRLGMRAATAELAIRHARKIPRQQLVEGLRALYDTDRRLKAGATNDRAVMEFVVARLTA